MELYDVMRTTFACREFTGEPVPQDVLHRIIDNARFAPSGGNRQGWRIINITDPAKKDRLAYLSLVTATRYLLQMKAGESPLNTIHPSAVTDDQVMQAEAPEWLVAHIRNALRWRRMAAHPQQGSRRSRHTGRKDTKALGAMQDQYAASGAFCQTAHKGSLQRVSLIPRPASPGDSWSPPAR